MSEEAKSTMMINKTTPKVSVPKRENKELRKSIKKFQPMPAYC